MEHGKDWDDHLPAVAYAFNLIHSVCMRGLRGLQNIHTDLGPHQSRLTPKLSVAAVAPHVKSNRDGMSLFCAPQPLNHYVWAEVEISVISSVIINYKACVFNL